MKKLNGYRVTHRNKWLLIRQGILSVQELALLEFYADIFDFDKNHQTYGTFSTDFKELAEYFNCKSQNTVRNWHNKLHRLGFIKATDKRGVFQLTCFERYVNPGKWEGRASEYAKQEKDQPIGIILQSFGINLQTIKSSSQPIAQKQDKIALESNSIAIGSYKDESNVYQSNTSVKKHAIASKEEYQQVTSRVDELGTRIGDNWACNDPQIQILVKEHQELANQMLVYELEHDLLPI